jgi:hypothetical protein
VRLTVERPTINGESKGRSWADDAGVRLSEVKAEGEGEGAVVVQLGVVDGPKKAEEIH